MIFQFFQNTGISDWVEVIHRHPGRLRLMIPALALAGNGFGKYAADARALLGLLPGMTEVSITLRTRTILFRYDPAVVSEAELLGWLDDLMAEGFRAYGAGGNPEGSTKASRIRARLKACVDRIRTEHAATRQNRTPPEI